MGAYVVDLGYYSFQKMKLEESYQDKFLSSKKGKRLEAELRQYKKNAIALKNLFVLKLPLFFTPLYSEWKSAAI